MSDDVPARAVAPRAAVTRLSAAQQRAVRLIHRDDYRWHEASGGARYRNHVPGRTPVIYRATLYALAQAHLVEHSVITPGRLALTDHGRAALFEIESRKRKAGGDG
jgi:hypothetical protein